MKRRNVIITILLLPAFVTYVATFARWWHQGQRYSKSVAGKQVEYLEFHYTWFSWHTRPVWIPALWLSAHLGGYHEAGFAAAYEDSMILYAR